MAIHSPRIGSVILLLAVHAAVAAGTIDLWPRMRKGDVFVLESCAKVHTDSAVLAARGELGDVGGNLEGTLKATLEVLAAEGGSPTSLKVTFDARECRIKKKNVMSPGGLWKEAIPPVAGKTVEVSVGAGGSLWFDGGASSDPEAMATLASALAAVTWYLPKQAVGVGDEWGADAERVSRALYALPKHRSIIRCKLDKIEEADARTPKAAHISITGTSSGRFSTEVSEHVSLRGVAVVEMPLGRIQVSLDGKSRVSGVVEREARTPQRTWKGPVGPSKEKLYQVEGTGTVEIRASLTSARNVASGETPGVAAPPREPAAPAAAGLDQFVGTFEDERLTVHIQKGEAGGLTGTLRIDGREFPFKARAAGGSLEGSFESEGNPYTFTATLQGDILTLTSGSMTYRLKRRPANPLDDEPDPGNPLDPAQPGR